MLKRISILTFLFLTLTHPAYAQKDMSAEVIHWWISGSEGAALKKVIDAFEKQGYTWVDTPVETSFHAKSAALSRVVDGNPPVMMQWHAGVSLQQLYREDILSNINELAEQEKWQDILPDGLYKYITVNEDVVAIPITLHGANWIWGNKKILDELSISTPKSWQEFIEFAPIIQNAGYIPLAIGGQAWQERVLFLSVLLDVGGADMYVKAIADHDLPTLQSKKMAEVFRVFYALKQFTDEHSPERSWNDTTRLIITGKAAFQVMGDWVKGELFQEGMIPDKDFTCSLSPGSNGHYLLVSDAFVMANVDDKKKREMQEKLAHILMSKKIQEQFSLIKGSIPPRVDIDSTLFDSCSQKAITLVSRPGSTLPGYNMANTGIMASSMMNVIHSFWKNGGDPQSAASDLAQAVKMATIQ